MNNKVKIFTENDYNSPDGMMTSIWGPALWHFYILLVLIIRVNLQQKIKNIIITSYCLLKIFYLVNIVGKIYLIILKKLNFLKKCLKIDSLFLNGCMPYMKK